MSVPVDLQLKLFDSLISPVLLYSCEIWGYENLGKSEKIHLQFCKKILQLRISTPNYMVYGELGRTPLDVQVKLRMVSFWSSLLKSDNKLSNTLYRLMVKLDQNGTHQFKWLNMIKSILNDTGFSEYWNNQLFLNHNVVEILVQQRLKDQFIQKWFSDIVNSSKGQLYSSFKNEFCLEPYLVRLPHMNRLLICKLRTSNLKLPIEIGRWKNIPREDRLCTLCQDTLVGDEFHYLFICKHPLLHTLRNKFLPKYFTVNPTQYKMFGLLSFCNVSLLIRLSIYLKKLVKLLQ